jgi:hypothetical protein
VHDHGQMGISPGRRAASLVARNVFLPLRQLQSRGCSPAPLRRMVPFHPRLPEVEAEAADLLMSH